MSRHIYATADGDILGIATKREYARIFVAPDHATAREWWADLEDSRIPENPGDGIAIDPEALDLLIGNATPGDSGEIETIYADDADEDDEPSGYRLGPLGRRLVRCAHPITGFREFLKVWQFLDQDSGQTRLLGEVLWVGQEHYVEVCRDHTWIYYLKARQLGETTIAIAYDAWVMRFRTKNARVHLVSRTEDLAKRSLLRPLKKGLQALPIELRLPVNQETTTIYELDAGPNDRRAAYAYPAKEPGRGETCSHLHLDEWAAMAETSPELPKDVWAAAEPTISKQGGTCHILTTGVGPVGYYADTWRNCIAGTGQLFASFIPAAGSRPEYSPEFLEAKRLALADDARFRHEYPQTWEDALSGAGDTFFTTFMIEKAAEYARGFAEPNFWRSRGGVLRQGYTDAKGRLRKRKYVKAWDIAGPGSANSAPDFTVGIVLDVTEDIWDVVHMIRTQGDPYPLTAWNIEQLHPKYPGPTYIEDNEAGAAVRAFVNLTEDDNVFGHRTTRQSKPVALNETRAALEAQELKWNPKDVPALDAEMRLYKLPDDNLVQDTVMALSLAVHYGMNAAVSTAGRILGVVRI